MYLWPQWSLRCTLCHCTVGTQDSHTYWCQYLKLTRIPSFLNERTSIYWNIKRPSIWIVKQTSQCLSDLLSAFKPITILRICHLSSRNYTCLLFLYGFFFNFICAIYWVSLFLKSIRAVDSNSPWTCLYLLKPSAGSMVYPTSCFEYSTVGHSFLLCNNRV